MSTATDNAPGNGRYRIIQTRAGAERQWRGGGRWAVEFCDGSHVSTGYLSPGDAEAGAQAALAKRSTVQHTPGPWRANGTLIEGPRMALTVARVDMPRTGAAPLSEAEARANVRLIERAPRMLDALRALLNGADCVTMATGGEPGVSDGWSAAKVARALVAEIEGR